MVFAEAQHQANCFHSVDKSEQNTCAVSPSRLYADCFIYSQMHSVYIFGGRHNIGRKLVRLVLGNGKE